MLCVYLCMLYSCDALVIPQRRIPGMRVRAFLGTMELGQEELDVPGSMQVSKLRTIIRDRVVAQTGLPDCLEIELFVDDRLLPGSDLGSTEEGQSPVLSSLDVTPLSTVDAVCTVVPCVHSCEPPAGPVAGGTSVKLHGVGFAALSPSTQVFRLQMPPSLPL